MNTNQPSRQEIEARITALLLGELPADEAALLRYTIAQDHELQKLHDELKATLVLVREAAKNPADAELQKSEALKLSAERRQNLMAHFKTPRANPLAQPEPLLEMKKTAKPEPLFWLRRIETPRLVPVLAAVALIVVLAAMLMPRLAGTSERARRAAALEDQRTLLSQMRSATSAPPPPMPGAAPANPTLTVTLAPEPQLAPPPATVPVQIVLPAGQPESDLLAVNTGLFPVGGPSGAQNPAPTLLTPQEIGSSITAPKNSHVYSHSAVGYVNLPTASGESAVLTRPPNNLGGLVPPPSEAPADTLALEDNDREKDVNKLARSEQMEKKWIVPGKATESPASTAGNENFNIILGPITRLPQRSFGGDGGGGGGGQNAQNGGAAGWAVNSFAGAGDFRNPGHGERGGGELPGTAATQIVAKNEILPGVSEVALEDEAAKRLVVQADRKSEPGKFKRSGNYEGFYSPSPADGAAPNVLAWNDKGVDRSRAENLARPPLADNAGVNFKLASPPAAAAPQGQIPAITPNGISSLSAKHEELFSARQDVNQRENEEPLKELNGDQLATTAHQSGGVGGIGDNTYYRKLAPEVEQPKVPSLGDIPVAGNLIQSSAQSSPPAPLASPAPAKPGAQVSGLSGNFAFADSRSQNITLLKEVNKPASGNLALAGGNIYIGGTTVSGDTVTVNTMPAGGADAGTLGVNSDSLKNGNANEANPEWVGVLSKPVPNPSSGPASKNENRFVSRFASTAPISAGLDQLQTTNSVVMSDGGDKAPYYAAKRDLDQKLAMHNLLHSKLMAEKLDLSLPEKSMVQITDPAQPGRSQNTWQRLTGQVESKARIKVENDVTDIPGVNGGPQITSFDPYFIQTTFEIIQSKLVLGKVVDALNLQSAWADKNGGQELNKSQAIGMLKQRLELRPVKNTKLVEIAAKSNDPKEAADIANAVAKAYADYRLESRRQLTDSGLKTLEEQFAQQENDIRLAQAAVDRLVPKSSPEPTPVQTDVPLRKPAPNAPVPQPEILTSSNAFSTFSLNVSDVSFKLAEASLQNGKLPDTASIRSEEFINAFDYRDPEAAEGQPMAFMSEQARYPFAHNRELLRFAVKTAAAGRQAGCALNLVLLLDNSGSMERADRVAIIREALRVLATQLQAQDTVSVVTFARTARLWADGISGDKAGATLDQIGGITPEGGTNLEEAMRLAYQTARRHYLAGGVNRVVLLTDGAANLGNVEPEALKQSVETQRKQGIALDCFGIGWEDYNDNLLEQLSSTGDGRYAFLNSPEDAAKDFAAKLAGALQIAAADVKVQVEFNPARVVSYRQIGYATHQLTKEQFRDNTVAAGQIAAQEAGNALYTIETNPNGDGPIATVHVRYKIPGTDDYRERSWEVAYTGSAPALEQTSTAMRLAAVASAFSEWLAASPYAQEVTLDELLRDLIGVPEVYGADDRPKQLETMIREAKSLEGK